MALAEANKRLLAHQNIDRGRMIDVFSHEYKSKYGPVPTPISGVDQPLFKGHDFKCENLRLLESLCHSLEEQVTLLRDRLKEVLDGQKT